MIVFVAMIDDVIVCMWVIDVVLFVSDGVVCFNWMYFEVIFVVN